MLSVNSVRKVLFWAHLAVGVVCGAVVLMMAVTGVLLTYEKQLEEWADRGFWVAPALPSQTATVDELVGSAAAHAAAPDSAVTHLTRFAGPDSPILARLDGGQTVYLDPSTADVRGEPSSTIRTFFSWMTRIHRWFGVQGEGRTLARGITGWSNALFLFLILSGLYLWMPRRWSFKHLRPRAWLNRGVSGRVRDFNWHHAFGFWASIPLFIVVFSATSISFPGFRNALTELIEQDTPSAENRDGEGASIGRPVTSVTPTTQNPDGFIEVIDRVLYEGPTQVQGWRSARLGLPRPSDDSIELRIERGWSGESTKRHTLVNDLSSGTPLSHETFSDLTRSERLRSFFRFAHTGEFFGLVGQTVAGLVSLAAAILVWTGLALSWRRLLRTRKRRNGRSRIDVRVDRRSPHRAATQASRQARLRRRKRSVTYSG